MASNLPGKTEAGLGRLSQPGQGSDHYYLRGKEISPRRCPRRAPHFLFPAPHA